jgi:hypothetical protein
MKATVQNITATLTQGPDLILSVQIHKEGDLYSQHWEMYNEKAWNFIARVREGYKSGTDEDLVLANLQQRIRKEIYTKS